MVIEGGDARRAVFDVRSAGRSSATGKHRNAADCPQSPLPEGLERNRAIERSGCLHGHGPMQAAESSIHPLNPIAGHRDPCEIVNRL